MSFELIRIPPCVVFETEAGVFVRKGFRAEPDSPDGDEIVYFDGIGLSAQDSLSNASASRLRRMRDALDRRMAFVSRV